MSNMYQTEAKEPRIDWKYPGVRARTPCIFLHFSFFFLNDFPVPINCLDCQSGLVMSKMYQTEAKEPQIDWKYTGVRARTPCIFFTFFNLVKNDFPVPINCLNCQSGLIMSKMCQTDAKEPWNILAYELVRRALLTRAILAFFRGGPRVVWR